MREPIDMTIRRRLDGVTWKVRITADLDEPDELHRHLETNARNLDNKDNGTRWLPEYSAEAVPLARPWESVTVVGVNWQDL